MCQLTSFYTAETEAHHKPERPSSISVPLNSQASEGVLEVQENTRLTLIGEDTRNMGPTKTLLKINIFLGIPVSAYEARPPSTPVEMICGMDLQLAVPDILFQKRSDVLI